MTARLIASSPDAELYEYDDGTWVISARVGSTFVVDRLETADLWPIDSGLSLARSLADDAAVAAGAEVAR